MENKKLWQEFIKWGGGFTLEAERDYKDSKEPLIYHLFMYGMWYPKDYEIIGMNLNKLLRQAIKDGKREMKKFYKKQNKKTTEKNIKKL